MKTIIITDPLNGFGLDLAQDLAKLGYFVIGICKNSKESENVKRTILHRYPRTQIETFVGDFKDIKNVRQVLLNIKLVMTNYKIDSIYAYIGNHHIFEQNFEVNSNDIEKQFFENYLANFIMAYSLMPYLQKEKNSKIILPALAPNEMSAFNIESVSDPDSYNASEAFKRAKSANAIIAGELNRRYNTGDTPVTTLLYQEKKVTKPEELNKDPKVKGLKKLFTVNDRMFRVYKGIEAILAISNHHNDTFYKFSKAGSMPLMSKDETLGAELFEQSLSLGRLKY